MKPYLPYNVLLVLAVITAGLTILYNYTVREGQAVTLQYRYPVVERVSEPDMPEPERFSSEADDTVPEIEAPEPDNRDEEFEPEPQRLTSVKFPLDINTATEEQLKFIPQVGDVMSRRIVQYREELGGYTDLEQLRSIKGVGDSTYKHLYAYLIIVGEQAAPEAEEAVPEAEEATEE